MVGVYVNNQRLDMFQDEGLSIEAKVKNFQDIATVTNAFTREFTVPASHNNNKIFNNYWMNELLLKNGVYTDFRLTQKARIELDGLPYLDGQISLLSINAKDAHPSSYTIYFTSNITNLVNIMGEKTIADLDWYDLNHELGNPMDVEAGLSASGSLFGDKVIYPMITDNKNEWSITSLTDGSISTYDFKPAVQITEILKRIGTDNNLTFISPLFDTDWVNKIYLWCSNEPDEELQSSSDYGTAFTTPEFLYWEPEEVDRSDRLESILTITPDAASAGIEYSVTQMHRELPDGTLTTVGTDTLTFNAYLTPNEGYVEFYIKAKGGIEFTFDFTLDGTYYQGTTVMDTYTDSGTAITVVTEEENFKRFLPAIKQVDFLKMLIKMYNLVILPIDDTTFEITTYDIWKNRGEKVEASKYIDLTEFKVIVPKIPKEYIFEWKEPTTAANEKFKELTGEAYGDEHAATKGNADNFEVKIDALETIMWDRLDGTANYYVAKSIDGKSEDPANLGGISKSYLMFWSEEATATISLDDGSGGTVDITDYKLCDSYYPTTATPTRTLNFGGELNSFTSIKAPDTVNLYYQFYHNIVNVAIDPQVRQYEAKGIVPLAKIRELRVSDILKIRDSYYFIEEYTYDTLNEEITLKLSDYVELTDIIGVTPPPAPINLVASDITQTTFTLDWDVVIDPDPNLTIERYDIYLDGVKHGESLTNQYLPTGLTAGSLGTWTVRAINSDGVRGIISAPLDVQMLAHIPYLLDNLTNTPVTAWSLRRLKDGIDSPCRIRRIADSSQKDVYFDDNDTISLNSLVEGGGTISNWIGSGDAKLTVLYDQSGNGLDFAHTDSSKQPYIIENGQFLKAYGTGFPAMEFIGTEDASQLNGSNSTVLNDDLAFYSVLSYGDEGTIMGNNPHGDGHYEFFIYDDGLDYNDNQNYINIAIGSPTINLDYYWWKRTAGDTLEAGWGNQPTSGSYAINAINVSATLNPIIGRQVDDELKLGAMLCEGILMDANLESDNDLIRDDIKSYYSI